MNSKSLITATGFSRRIRQNIAHTCFKQGTKRAKLWMSDARISSALLV